MTKKSFAEWESVSSCDLCSSKKIRQYYKGANVNIMVCEDCSYYFTNPRPTLEEIASSYSQDDFYDGWLKEDRGRMTMWKKRAMRILANSHPGKNVLDYSAGIGTFLHLLKNKGYNVFGTEISESAKKIAKTKYDISLANDADFEEVKYKGFFDIITAWHVVEHVHSPSKLIQWFHKLLKPGGILVIAVPNINHHPIKDFFNSKIDSEMVFSPMTPGTELHLSHFSHDTLSKFLESSGFKVEVNSIDDHYPTQTIKNRLRYYITKATFNLTNKDKSGAMLMIAKKR